MRKSLLFSLLACSTLTATAQHWKAIGDPLDEGVKTLLDAGNGQFYAGGAFVMAGSTQVNGIMKWDGVRWTAMGSGITGTSVNSLCHYNGGLVAAGQFTAMNGVSSKNISFFNGTNWLPLGDGLRYTGATTVSTLTVFSGELYAGGIFDSSGTTRVAHVARWDGSSWQSLGTGLNGPVHAMTVYNGELYVGGSFTSAGGIAVNNVARWNGVNWSDVGGGVQYTGATTVSTLQVHNNELYVGGTFSQAGTTAVSHLATWNGSGWSAPQPIQYTGATTVSTISLCVYNYRIAAEVRLSPTNNSGDFYSIYVDDGSGWERLESTTTEPKETLAEINDTLYAAGRFSTISQDPVTFIARWMSGSQRLHTFTDENQILGGSFRFTIVPNPSSAEFTILPELEEGYEQEYVFELCDISGRLILSVPGLRDRYTVERGSLSAGVYYYRIKSPNGGLLDQGKLSIR